MKDAFKKVHKKAEEIGTVEPKQEFTPIQHSGWSGFREVLITAAEIRRKCRLLDEKVQWVRRALGADEIKRRKKELNSMRSDLNAYRWRARTEWVNKKVLDLQMAEEAHDLGAIHRILRETGLRFSPQHG